MGVSRLHLLRDRARCAPPAETFEKAAKVVSHGRGSIFEAMPTRHVNSVQSCAQGQTSGKSVAFRFWSLSSLPHPLSSPVHFFFMFLSLSFVCLPSSLSRSWFVLSLSLRVLALPSLSSIPCEFRACPVCFLFLHVSTCHVEPYRAVPCHVMIIRRSFGKKTAVELRPCHLHAIRVTKKSDQRRST